jgi:hypothetical protein
MKSAPFNWWAVGLLLVCASSLLRIESRKRERDEIMVVDQQAKRLQMEYVSASGRNKQDAMIAWGNFLASKKNIPHLNAVVDEHSLQWRREWRKIYAELRPNGEPLPLAPGEVDGSTSQFPR